jgi:hypothetical protein
MAEIAAAKLTWTSLAYHVHLQTFGAPSATGPDAPVKTLRSVRRFAHANDPVARLFPADWKYAPLAPALGDDATTVEVGGARLPSSKHTAACRSLACHTAYLQIDFREPDIMAFQHAMPPGIATMMLDDSLKADVAALWARAYTSSTLLTARGKLGCTWALDLNRSPPASPR